MSKRDYYEVLGVGKNASDAELKKAYRKQAMQYHPDRNPDDKQAEVKFKEAGEAYDCLKDSQKRAAYDQMGHAAFEGGMGGGARGGAGGGFGGFNTSDFGDMFEDMFGGGSAGEDLRGADLRYNLSINLEDAYNGKSAKVNIPTSVSCGTCKGSGAKPGTKPTTCGTCNGAGQVRMQQGFFAMTRTCPKCSGTGKIIPTPCTDCNGQGRVKKEKTISIKIPAGVDDGTRIRVAGEGDAGRNGALSGDLYIFIQMKAHPLFRREGPHLALDIPLDFVEAALGGSIEVPTPDGHKSVLKVPAGTQPNTQFRMRGKGMPVLNSKSYGDLFVNVDVEVPTKLSKKQKELLEQFKEAYTGDNHPEQEGFFKKAAKFWG